MAGEAAQYAVPARRTDLAGLPPAWISWSEIELFAAEDAAYAQALADAGVEVVVETVPNAPHGFQVWAAQSVLARRVVSRAREWLGERLAVRDASLEETPQRLRLRWRWRWRGPRRCCAAARSCGPPRCGVMRLRGCAGCPAAVSCGRAGAVCDAMRAGASPTTARVPCRVGRVAVSREAAPPMAP